ncbi:hypothetical protein K443DRAFT_549840 [Laccaria amethystina LaAM-08-1]|uniref:Uncharacterized protein n=1 Tax=Laccaria amethystina LaAM-08-1 TaxID=1095629 RepID=A0A0C9WYB7_9AGAR|nr:hypothetical protein K443DRAFT_549840 [Laccaria amethystina LaAM-08-1]
MSMSGAASLCCFLPGTEVIASLPYLGPETVFDIQDGSERILKECMLKDFKIHMHCFSNIPDFAARLFTHFPNFTLDRRYRSHSFLLFPRYYTETIPWTAEFATSMARLDGMLRVMIMGGEYTLLDTAVFERIQGVLCSRSGRRETLSTTTTAFSMFSALRLAPVHPTPPAPNSFSLLMFTNMSCKFPHPPIPTHHHLVPAPLSSLDSRMGRQFGLFQEEITLFWGR